MKEKYYEEITLKKLVLYLVCLSYLQAWFQHVKSIKQFRNTFYNSEKIVNIMNNIIDKTTVAKD